MKLNIKKAFITPLKDKTWIKIIIIGGFVSSTIFTIPIANGYLTLYLYSLIKFNDQKLPPWTEIRNILIISLKLLVIDIVYLLPMVFIGVVTQPHDALSFKKTVHFWGPVVLIVIFFLNLAHVRFVQNNFKISAGFNIRKILSLLIPNIKEYMVVYIFDAILLLILFIPIFIDYTLTVGWVFYYSLELIISIFLFYAYLVINNMLAMVFKDEGV